MYNQAGLYAKASRIRVIGATVKELIGAEVSAGHVNKVSDDVIGEAIA